MTAAGVAALLAGGGSAWAVGAPATVPANTCTGVVQIDRLAFHRPSALPGATAPASLSVTNCTAQSQTVTEEWIETFTPNAVHGTSSHSARRPLLEVSQVFAPNATVNSVQNFTVPGGPTTVTLTVQLLQGSTLLASASSSLRIDTPITTG